MTLIWNIVGYYCWKIGGVQLIMRKVFNTKTVRSGDRFLDVVSSFTSFVLLSLSVNVSVV